MKTVQCKSLIFLLVSFAFLFVIFSGISLAQEDVKERTDFKAIDDETKPLVVYYSRTGNCKMVATALKNQLGCELAEIVSKEKKGVGSIMRDQLFNLDDDQQPFVKELKNYNPIVIAAPIWFMRLSSPARTFIKKTDLMGKDVYIFTTSCGPLAGWVSNTIRGFATSHGLNVKSVQGFQISKKTEGGKRVPKAQADFDKDIQEFLIKTPIEQ